MQVRGRETVRASIFYEANNSYALDPASIQLDETLTIAELLMTVKQVSTDTSRVLLCAQRLFDALNHTA